MLNKTFITLLVVPVAIAFWVRTLRGFETDTHTTLSEKATDASKLNTFLTTVLGFEFQQGIFDEIGQGEFKQVRELIANVGAVNEDKPEFRSRNHFHDPTKAWAQAGLSGLFQSSLLWSQNPNQDWGGKRSWQDARNSYFNALTATNNADRKRYYAETFESIGHLIHLVQDAATPAHTRNDWHVGVTTGSSVFPALNVDRFHQWAKFQGAGAINSAGSLPFDSSILNQSYNGLAPIAGIIDTTTSAGQGIPSNATNIGIAEFSNANFFSDDTILQDYTFPNISQMDIRQEPGPDGVETRSYLRKNYGPGPTGYRTAVSTRLIEYLPLNFSPRQFELDDNVMVDYGNLLFPRAIGYSAGLIDYFFRGKIDSTELSPTFNWVEWGTQSNSIRVENVSVKVDGTNEHGGQGTMRLVLLFRGTDSGETFPSVIVSEPVSVNAGSGQSVVFSFSSLPYPATHPPVYGTYSALYWGMLVYKGPLGQESEAVVVDSSCINPTNGARYARMYDFEHGIGITLTSGLWEESAYFEGC